MDRLSEEQKHVVPGMVNIVNIVPVRMEVRLYFQPTSNILRPVREHVVTLNPTENTYISTPKGTLLHGWTAFQQGRSPFLPRQILGSPNSESGVSKGTIILYAKDYVLSTAFLCNTCAKSVSETHV